MANVFVEMEGLIWGESSFDFLKTTTESSDQSRVSLFGVSKRGNNIDRYYESIGNDEENQVIIEIIINLNHAKLFETCIKQKLMSNYYYDHIFLLLSWHTF